MPTELSADELSFLIAAFDLARSGREQELVALVEAGLPVNLTNSAGDTLLILAAYHARAATVKALLDLGADTSRINDRGQTALAAAAFRSSTESVRALLEAGADPALGERSALAIAEFFGLMEMLVLLRRIDDHGRGSTAGAVDC